MKSANRDSVRLAKKLRKLEVSLYTLTEEIEKIRDEILFPIVLERVKKELASKRIEVVYVTWLQEQFDVGYSRAVKLLSKLQKQGVGVSLGNK